MAFAILEIRYVNNMHSTELLPFEDQKALETRIEALLKRPQVSELITYHPTKHLTRKQVWEES